MFEVFFLFPSPPQKRVKERGAGVARERHTGTTLFINLGWGAYWTSGRRLRMPRHQFRHKPLCQRYEWVDDFLHWTKTTSSAESPGLTSRKSSGRSRRSI